MKRIIVGKSPVRSSTPLRASESWVESITSPVEGVCRKIEAAYIEDEGVRVMHPDTAYVWDAAHGLKCPRPIITRRVEIQGDISPMSNALVYEKSKEKAIAFVCSGRKFPVGLYYEDSKSLIVYFDADGVIIRQIADWIMNNLFNTPPTESVGVFKEIHDGKEVEVYSKPYTINVTVGCDPEFECLDSSNRPVQVPERYRKMHDKIGMDGSGAQLELRPSSGAPEDVVTEMRNLFSQVSLPVSAIGDRYPLGGHIHLGVGHQYTPPADLLWLLDHLIGIPAKTLNGKARGTYGKESDYKCKPWGFEYRTPPAGIFASPALGYLFLKIAKNVTEAYVNERTMRVSSERPSEEDYMNYGLLTKEECEVMFTEMCEFVKSSTDEGYSVDLRHAWDDKFPRILSGEYVTSRDRIQQRLQSVNVTLSDEWARFVMEKVGSELEAMGIVFIQPVTIYGLAANRGEVISGFDMEGYERIEHSAGYLTFGVPYSVRMGHAPVEGMVRAIVRQIRGE